MSLKVQLKILDSRIGTDFPMPAYATSGSAGIDLRAMLQTESIVVNPGETVLINTGISIYIGEANFAGIILPRSGLGHKNGIVLGNLVGLVDSDYQGELLISCWNRSINPFTLNNGDRLAQYVLVPISHFDVEVVENFTATERGEGGFGHSGTN